MAAGKKRILGLIGFIIFVVGMVIAVVGGILSPQNSALIVTLVVLGVIIGLLNITARETLLFLVSVIALVVVGNVFAPLKALNIGNILGNILSYVATLMAPAAIIAAIKALWVLGKPGD